VKPIDRLLEQPLVYRLWQQPFVEDKLAPLHRNGEIARAKRVLDVGCGPGINTRHFENTDYLGVDINPDYIADATQKFQRRFVVADVTTYSAANEGVFDFILVNSMLHHLSPDGVHSILSHLATLVSDDGYAHILDIVVPEQRLSIARLLTWMDRGDYPRPIGELRELVERSFDIVASERYPLSGAGVTLWEFAYFKARPRVM
jgi:SAM-dependent methyltransferase